MAHRFEHIPKAPQLFMSLTDDLHDLPVRLWVNDTGEDDLCLVFANGEEFRAWFDQLVSEGRRMELVP
jgi:hypothetical protein